MGLICAIFYLYFRNKDYWWGYFWTLKHIINNNIAWKNKFYLFTWSLYFHSALIHQTSAFFIYIVLTYSNRRRLNCNVQWYGRKSLWHISGQSNSQRLCHCIQEDYTYSGLGSISSEVQIFWLLPSHAFVRVDIRDRLSLLFLSQPGTNQFETMCGTLKRLFWKYYHDLINEELTLVHVAAICNNHIYIFELHHSTSYIKK